MCECTDNLLHSQTLDIGECPANRLLVYMLIGVKANNQLVTFLTPLLQLGNKVLPEFGLWACKIALLGDKVSMVLLIGCAANRILVVARVVTAYYPSLTSITSQTLICLTLNISDTR
jgi:hypothetical protein